MSLELLASTIALFGAVALLCGTAAARLLQHSAPEQQRLRAIASAVPSPSGLPVDFVPLADDGHDPSLRRLRRTLPRSPDAMIRLRRQLAAAGYYGIGAAITYSSAELMLPIPAAAAVLLAFGVRDGWMLAIVTAVLGYLLPGLWLGRRIAARKKAIRNGLPDALDLFVVCMEAGSSLDQAIVKASEELEISHPALCQELRFVTTEIRAGKPRIEAFKNFAKRTAVDDVRSLVAMLVQTDRFGTSVAQALRTHGANARTKRRQRAEERAHKVGVKLVFPLVLCLFPGVYVVCIGPVVVAIYRSLF